MMMVEPQIELSHFLGAYDWVRHIVALSLAKEIQIFPNYFTGTLRTFLHVHEHFGCVFKP